MIINSDGSTNRSNRISGNFETLSEAELLETLNRRANLSTIGVEENGNRTESMEESIEKVMNMANTLEAGIDERDISVAHRLPSRTASLQILKMMKTDEHITSAWTKEVNFQ